MQGVVQRIEVAPPVKEYIARLLAATRDDDEIALGVSPRGGSLLRDPRRRQGGGDAGPITPYRAAAHLIAPHDRGGGQGGAGAGAGAAVGGPSAAVRRLPCVQGVGETSSNV